MQNALQKKYSPKKERTSDWDQKFIVHIWLKWTVCDDSDDASDVSDSESEQPLRSDDEKDLDAAKQTGRETVSAAAAADTSAGQRKKRKTFHNTTPEEVAARCTQGCSCSNKNCFTSLSQAGLLAYRNLMEKMESSELQMYLAG